MASSDPQSPHHACASGWKYFGRCGIINPLGFCLAGPLYDEGGILIAEVNLQHIGRAKAIVEVTGLNSRPDVFSLRVNTKTNPLILVQKVYEE